MNKEEIEEIETLKIDFKDVNELELALEVSSKKAIYLIDDLIKHLFELQQENKQLKTNRDELKKWLEENKNRYIYQDSLGEDWYFYDLDIFNELGEILDKVGGSNE